ncbi:MAG: hypothetical protein AB1791_03055 [Chloroflexota bacterium]
MSADLERRVKTLEQEVKVLKNQIQATLLDIQEQILSHYHSSLKGEELGAEDDSSPSPESRSARPGEGGKKEPAAKLKQAPADEDHAQDTRSGRREGAAQVNGKGAAQPAAGVDWTTFAGLTQWANQSVAKLGQAHTRQMIDMQAKQGHLAAEVQDALSQLVALSPAGDPPEQVEMREILDSFLKLNELLGYQANLSQALALLREGNFG